MPILVLPATTYRVSFAAAVPEFQAEGRFLELDAARLTDGTEFARYVEEVLEKAVRDAPRPVGVVPETVLWYVDDAEYLGRVSIRHALTPRLRKLGGHIGYDVRPTVRRRGHATAMLAMALPIAAGLGIDPALITCDAANTASRRVIEANGGQFAETDGATLRFWAPTCVPAPVAREIEGMR